MKKETLKLVLEIMEERELEDDNRLLEAAANVEYSAACAMSTSGDPDWLAPFSVSKRDIVVHEEALLSTKAKKGFQPTLA